MQTYRVGVDIVEIQRIAQVVDRWGPRFLDRIYTEAEMDFCGGRVRELAVRFAGKEAVMKALGTGTRGVSWRDIEILADRRGAPVVFLRRRARRRARRLKLGNLAISLSHSRHYAVASVVGGSEQD